jgi:SPP1 family predicted phage head-tail adaptor
MVFGMYRPGELNERITLQSKVYIPDGLGGGSLSLEPVATVWAAVRPASGGETENSERVEATTKYKFILRYRTDLTAAQVVLWRGIDYNVRAILDRGPSALYLEIEAERGVAP